MPRLNKNELNKLPPEARLKRLKEIEEEDKQELKEAAELIKKVELELKSPKKEIEAPPIEVVDISRLFERESGLEAAAQGAPRHDIDVIEEIKAEYSISQLSYETSEEKVAQPVRKIEESRYSPASDDVLASTATMQTLKNIKKYDKG